MTRLEINANTLEEAKISAFSQGITVIRNVTRTWEKKGKPMLTNELDAFAAEIMNDMSLFEFENSGIIITLSAGTKDTKVRPYTLHNYKRVGRCTTSRTIQIRDRETDEILAIAETKTDAIIHAKRLMRKHKRDMYGTTVYEATSPDFDLVYNPSKSAEIGQYLVFAVDKGDVTLSKQKKIQANL